MIIWLYPLWVFLIVLAILTWENQKDKPRWEKVANEFLKEYEAQAESYML